MKIDASRRYWARYENAHGETWETVNPANRASRLKIRRVRWPNRVEAREQRARSRARTHGVEWERKALDELRAGMRDEPRTDESA